CGASAAARTTPTPDRPARPGPVPTAPRAPSEPAPSAPRPPARPNGSTAPAPTNGPAPVSVESNASDEPHFRLDRHRGGTAREDGPPAARVPELTGRKR